MNLYREFADQLGLLLFGISLSNIQLLKYIIPLIARVDCYNGENYSLPVVLNVYNMSCYKTLIGSYELML